MGQQRDGRPSARSRAITWCDGAPIRESWSTWSLVPPQQPGDVQQHIVRRPRERAVDAEDEVGRRRVDGTAELGRGGGADRIAGEDQLASGAGCAARAPARGGARTGRWSAGRGPRARRPGRRTRATSDIFACRLEPVDVGEAVAGAGVPQQVEAARASSSCPACPCTRSRTRDRGRPHGIAAGRLPEVHELDLAHPARRACSRSADPAAERTNAQVGRDVPRPRDEYAHAPSPSRQHLAQAPFPLSHHTAGGDARTFAGSTRAT